MISIQIKLFLIILYKIGFR